MKKRHYPIIIEQDMNGVFIVSCPSFRGCHSYGDTIDEAMVNISEAITVCMEESAAESEEINRFVGVRDVEVMA